MAPGSQAHAAEKCFPFHRMLQDEQPVQEITVQDILPGLVPDQVFIIHTFGRIDRFQGILPETLAEAADRVRIYPGRNVGLPCFPGGTCCLFPAACGSLFHPVPQEVCQFYTDRVVKEVPDAHPVSHA